MENFNGEVATVRKIGALSLATTSAMGGVFVGLIFGIFTTILYLVVGSALSASGVSMSGAFGSFTGPFAIILFPIVFGLSGFVSGLVGGWMYNLSAKITGGIKLYSE